VAGELVDDEPPIEYAADLATFACAWAWDQCTLEGTPVIQAQAVALDHRTEQFLSSSLEQLVTTRGWPCHRNLRFENDEVTVLLWACDGQCDWWITGRTEDALERWTATLMGFSNLRTSLWSNDDAGVDLLARIRPQASAD